MRKKLFAIVMSMTMVASFMPSLAFAAGTVEYKTDDTCWEYKLGDTTATLVKAYKYVGGTKTETLKFNAPATVSYLNGDNGTGTDAWACGKTVAVKSIKFETKSAVAKDEGGNLVKITGVDDTDFSFTFPAHEWVTVPAKAATCTEAGNYEYKKCSVCEAVTGYNSDSKTPFDNENDARIAAKGHNATVASNSVYWIDTDKNGTPAKYISKLAELKCDDCGKSFAIDHTKDDTTATPYPYKAVIKQTVAGTMEDCTVGQVTTSKATVVVSKAHVSEVGTTSRPDVNVNVHYVSKATGPSEAKHDFTGGNKWAWNDDFTKCVYKVNKCTRCDVAEKEIECTVTKKSNSTCETAKKPTIKATCTVTAEEGPISNTVNKDLLEKEPVLAHEYTLVAAKDATCTKPGYKEHYECKNGCENWYRKTSNDRYVVVDKNDYITARTHVLEADYTMPSKEALATDFFADGDIDTVVPVTDIACSKCNKVFASNGNATFTVDGIKYNELNKGKNACVDSIVLPLTVKVTANSGADVFVESKTVALDAKDHTLESSDAPKFVWNTDDADNATCEVVFKSCTFKNWVYNETEEDFEAAKDACGAAAVALPATVEKKVDVEPTCTKTGAATYTASYKHSTTGRVYTETKKVVLPKADHKVEVETVDATCTEAGVKTIKCSVCNKVYETVELPALGHNFVKTDDVKAPTCTEAGHQGYKCSACDETKVEELPALGHTVVEDAAVAATATKTGLTAGSHCSVCNEVLEAQVVTVAKAKTPSVKAGKKALTVTASKVTGATKYQVAYKRSGSKYAWKYATASTKNAQTIKNLVKGKKYYVKVRTISGDVVGAWSSTKSVKVK